MQTVLAVLTWAAITAAPALAQVPVTQMTAISRQAGQAGTSLELRLETGQFLTEVDRLVFSHPLIQASVLHAPALPFDIHPPMDQGRFSVTIDAAVPPGIYEAWAVGAYGVSNPLPFLVSDAPVVAVGNQHAAADQAVELVPGQWVQARCQAEQVHHYKLDLQAGQHLHVHSLAQTLDSRALLQLRLFSPDGACVLDAVPIDGADPRCDYASEVEGTYVLQVSDFLFRGGSPYTYLLSATVTPEATPPARPALLETLAQLRRFGQPGKPLPAELPQPQGVAAASLPTLPEGLKPLVHDEQATPDTQPLPIPLPGLVQGKFLTDRIDEDAFRFQASQGARIAIEVISQRLGQATDPMILVFDSPAESSEKSPKLLAQNDDLPAVGTAAVRSVPRDSGVLFTAPHDGEFVVRVRDQFNARPADAPVQYLLSVAPATPGFELFAYVPHGSNNDAQSQPTGLGLSPGGTTAIEVFAVRQQGFNGPIDVAIKNLPTGVVCQGGRIAASQNRTTLLLSADINTIRTLHTLQIEGAAADLPAPGNVKRAYAATIASAAHGHRNVVGHRLTSALMLDILDHPMWPTDISVSAAAEGMRMARGGKLRLPVQVTRDEEAPQPVIFRGRNLPANTSLPDFTLAADQAAGHVEFRIAPKAATGTFDFWIQAETTLTYPGNQQRKQLASDYLQRLRRIQELDPQREGLKAAIDKAAERLKQVQEQTKPLKRKVFLPLESFRVEIVEAPFETTLGELPPVTAGESSELKLKLSLARQFGFAGPVTVELLNPPAGITAPKTTLPAEQQETVVPLSVAAEAAAGELTLQLKLQYDFGGVQTVQRTAKLTVAK
ncbi:hypothetical protein [Roseimaritima ulvae]|nr:hypothetical protein [Roseimaritima ulvae]